MKISSKQHEQLTQKAKGGGNGKEATDSSNVEWITSTKSKISWFPRVEYDFLPGAGTACCLAVFRKPQSFNPFSPGRTVKTSDFSKPRMASAFQPTNILH